MEHSFTLTADHYHTGQGKVRYKGRQSAPNQPPIIPDLYIERWVFGANPPRRLKRITVEWDDDERDEDDPRDV